MKLIICLIALLLLSFASNSDGAVETEGIIDELVRDISKNISQYKRDTKSVLQEVSTMKDQIEGKKKRLKKADDENSLIIKSEVTKDVSKLIDSYQEYLGLTEDMLRDTLPKLQSLNESLNTNIIGRFHQRLNDKKYYKTLDNIFSNLAGVALLLDDPELKNEIGDVLGNIEAFYKQAGDDRMFQKIRANIDRVVEGYSRILASVSVQKKILEGKRAEVMLNIKLTKYILALNTLSDGKDLMGELGKMSKEIAKIDVPSVEVGETFGDNELFYQDNHERLERYSEQGLELR